MSERQIQRYQRIIESFETVAREQFGERISVLELCIKASITHRTLCRAFRTIHNTTPTNHLTKIRLNQVREQLSSFANTATVTEIALRFGFRELGRFAARYRAAFGESPSETKRNGRRRERQS